jgi:hypothetical protein
MGAWSPRLALRMESAKNGTQIAWRGHRGVVVASVLVMPVTLPVPTTLLGPPTAERKQQMQQLVPNPGLWPPTAAPSSIQQLAHARRWVSRFPVCGMLWVCVSARTVILVVTFGA